MSKKSKGKRMKLPKRLLGVKVPKDARRQINGLLKLAPHDAAKPLIAMAVGTVAVALAEKLEHPLQELLKRDWPSHTGKSDAARKAIQSEATQ